MKDYLIRSGEKFLSYFSDKELQVISDNPGNFVSTTFIDKAYYSISGTEYSNLDSDADLAEIKNDKLIFFFRNLLCKPQIFRDDLFLCGMVEYIRRFNRSGAQLKQCGIAHP